MRKQLVGPILASEWITKIDVQRNLKEHNVRKYAEDMRDGRWGNDITPIVFDTNGNLVNGQHRLHAIVQSGVPTEFWILEDVEPEDIQRMDSGIGRTVSDQLAIKGIKNSHAVQSIARIVMQYERYPDQLWNTSNLVPSKAAIVDRVMEEPELFEAAAIMKARFRLPGAAANSSFGAFWFLAMQGDFADELPEYIEGLLTGANLNESDSRLALRAYITRENLSFWGSGQSHLITHAIAWKKWVKREPCSMLRTPHRSLVGDGRSMPTVV